MIHYIPYTTRGPFFTAQLIAFCKQFGDSWVPQFWETQEIEAPIFTLMGEHHVTHFSEVVELVQLIEGGGMGRPKWGAKIMN